VGIGTSSGAFEFGGSTTAETGWEGDWLVTATLPCSPVASSSLFTDKGLRKERGRVPGVSKGDIIMDKEEEETEER